MMSQQSELVTFDFAIYVKNMWFVFFEVFLKESSYVRFILYKSFFFSFSLVKRLQKRSKESRRQRELSVVEFRVIEGDNFDRYIGNQIYGDVDRLEECLGRKISMVMMNQIGRMREGEVLGMVFRGLVCEIEQIWEVYLQRERSVFGEGMS